MRKRDLTRIRLHKAPRTLCPVCGVRVALTTERRIWVHSDPPTSGRVCPGSSRKDGDG
jgi:hypothetical protein